MTDYPPGGVLFSNKRKKTETQPDFTGDLELSDEVVSDLVSQMERGVKKPKIALAGWKKVSKKGLHFVSLRGSVFKDREERPPQMPADDFNMGPSKVADEDTIPF